jgi:hypothetical protein
MTCDVALEEAGSGCMIRTVTAGLAGNGYWSPDQEIKNFENT